MNYLYLLIIFFILPTAYAVSTDNKFQHEILSLHNTLRSYHHSPKLVWDNQLSAYAFTYASQCEFKHSHGPYGENLATGYPSVNAAINGWYNESEQYSYRNPGFSMATGHFTQMVWKSTTKIGCALVACNGKNGTPGNFLICEYSPFGNVTNSGYFEANVFPVTRIT